MNSFAIRFDSGSLTSKPVEDADGYLRVDATICVPGILRYINPITGKETAELRTAETNQQIVQSLNSRAVPLPISEEHPPFMLNAKNIQSYMIGAIGTTRFDDFTGGIIAPLGIYRQESKDAIFKGEKTETSLGYKCATIKESGTWRGERYDAIQTDIQENHLAITARARAGRDVKIHMDSAYMDSLLEAMQVDGDKIVDIGYSYHLDSDSIIATPRRNYYFMENPQQQNSFVAYKQPLEDGGEITHQVHKDSLPVINQKDQTIRSQAEEISNLKTRLDSFTKSYQDWKSYAESLQEELSDRQDSTTTLMSQDGFKTITESQWESIKGSIEQLGGTLRLDSKDDTYVIDIATARFDSEANFVVYTKEQMECLNGILEVAGISDLTWDGNTFISRMDSMDEEDEEDEDPEEEMDESKSEEAKEPHQFAKKKKKMDSVEPSEFLKNVRKAEKLFPALAARFDSEFPEDEDALFAAIAEEAKAVLVGQNPASKDHLDSLEPQAIVDIYHYYQNSPANKVVVSKDDRSDSAAPSSASNFQALLDSANSSRADSATSEPRLNPFLERTFRISEGYKSTEGRISL